VVGKEKILFGVEVVINYRSRGRVGVLLHKISGESKYDRGY
jgi:hypothetical protein